MYADIVSNSQRGIDLRQFFFLNKKRLLETEFMICLYRDGIIYFRDGILFVIASTYSLRPKL